MGFRRLSKAEARQETARLVAAFRGQAGEVTGPGSGYTETEARGDFIDPLLEALGWDVHNRSGARQAERQVVLERSGANEGAAIGRPDYRLRHRGRDWLPVEAKKPSVRLAASADAARQARSYGWSLSLPAAVLTSFAELAIYDTTVEIHASDGPDTALIPGLRFSYDQFADRFDELWAYVSYESLKDDGLSAVYSYTEPPRGTSPFDRSFLDHFRRWRRILAASIAENNPALGAPEVGRRTQRLLNALLFLRVCEDRNIGSYEGLLAAATAHALPQAFRDFGRLFNAGMFDVLGCTRVADEEIAAVIGEMYWPKSKFAYGVLRPDILAGVYEQYLAERIELAADRSVRLAEKPELTHAGGVVPTPGPIAGRLLEMVLGPRLPAGEPVPPSLTVLDPACGSGVFLVSALELLATAAESAGEPNTLATRARLAKEHLFGVDIDGEAVEVAKLSLLLTVLGDEVVDTRSARALLPGLSGNVQTGNALIGADFDQLVPAAAAVPERRAAVAPFDFRVAFAAANGGGRFSVVIGNPPYTRIQTLVRYLPDHVAYLRDARAGYCSARAHNFDIYMLFIEKALGLLTPDGTLAFIVPHRFTTGPAGIPVRELLGPRLLRMVHFGEEQVFHRRSTYTCLIEAGAPTGDPAVLELAHDLPAWLAGGPCPANVMERWTLGAQPWPIASAEAEAVFARMERAAVARLGDPGWAEIFVGVQTSADDVFFVKPDPLQSRPDTVAFSGSDGRSWEVERGILREAVRDAKLLPYDVDPPPDALVFFPYELREPNELFPAYIDRSRWEARILSPAQMAERYPKALAYFAAHEPVLRAGRDVSPGPGPAFWAYGRSQSLTKIDQTKIIARVLSLTPRYAIDYRGLVAPSGGDGGPYYLLSQQPGCPLSLPVLVALLSHPAVDAYVASRGKAYRGGYVVHRKAFLEQVPVPALSAADMTQIEKAVAEIHDLVRRMRTETDTALRVSIDERIVALRSEAESLLTAAYGLTQDEVDRAAG